MTDVKVPAPPQPGRVIFTILMFVGLCAVLAGRLHHLQVEAADDLSALGERQRKRQWSLPAPRGAIVAADGTPLVVTASVWNCLADPSYMDDKLGATIALADLLGVDRDELRGHFESGRNGRVIAKHLDVATKEAIDKLGLHGIYMRPAYHREQLNASLAAHVLGFVHADGHGGGGIEQTMDGLLKGVPGYERFQADARGRPLVGPGYERVAARPGAHVVLTLVPAIQQELEAAIAAAVESHNPKGVCGMVVRPATGEVLAMASWPTFDPADPGAVPSDHWRDRNLAFIYESGSTMKPLIVGAAVADGIVNWQTKIDCENGSWRTPYRPKPLSSHPHGVLSIVDIIALSDNIGMAKMFIDLAKRHGIERAHDWMTTFGFGAKTGIELPGEQYGILPRSERWRMDTVMTASFGQGVSVTPIQMIFAHAAIANEGVWMPPRLIDRIERSDPETGRRIVERPDRVGEPRRVTTVAVADGIERMMVAVMGQGTGTKLQLDGYSSAGKTGTTDVLVNGRYLKRGGPHIGSFVGWAPAVPGVPAEAVCLVVVDQPREADGKPRKYPYYFGGRTGGPVVQRVLQFSMEELGVPTDRPVAGDE